MVGMTGIEPAFSCMSNRCVSRYATCPDGGVEPPGLSGDFPSKRFSLEVTSDRALLTLTKRSRISNSAQAKSSSASSRAVQSRTLRKSSQMFMKYVLTGGLIATTLAAVSSRPQNGRGGGNRTPNRWLKRPLLCRLSYTPVLGIPNPPTVSEPRIDRISVCITCVCFARCRRIQASPLLGSLTCGQSAQGLVKRKPLDLHLARNETGYALVGPEEITSIVAR